jgi:nicotinamide mononucleotide transporter
MPDMSNIFSRHNLLRPEKLAEIVAVVFSFLYTYLYIKGNPWCWAFALVGSAIFMILCYQKKLLAESALQLFYVAMAVYGYVTMSDTWQTNSWGWGHHLILIALGTVMMFGMAAALKRFTDAQMPLEDSFTTAFALVATWVMVNYVHENYLYWIVIDAVSVHLYWKRELYFGSALYFVYTLMVTAGYFGWM